MLSALFSQRRGRRQAGAPGPPRAAAAGLPAGGRGRGAVGGARAAARHAARAAAALQL